MSGADLYFNSVFIVGDVLFEFVVVISGRLTRVRVQFNRRVPLTSDIIIIIIIIIICSRIRRPVRHAVFRNNKKLTYTKKACTD